MVVRTICAAILLYAVGCAPAPAAEPYSGPAAPGAAGSAPAPDDMAAATGAASPASHGCMNAGRQGGVVVCRLPAGADVSKNGSVVAEAENDGLAVVGLTQHEASPVIVGWRAGDVTGETAVTVSPREDEFRELSGLECDKVDARTEAQKAHAARSWQPCHVQLLGEGTTPAQQ